VKAIEFLINILTVEQFSVKKVAFGVKEFTTRRRELLIVPDGVFGRNRRFA